MATITEFQRYTKIETRKKILLTTAAIICQLTYKGGGFTGESDVVPRLIYSFLHVNVWHLLCNLAVLWTVRNRIDITAAYGIAFVVSFFPMSVSCPTSGMSGLLFAMFGIMWGKTGHTKAALRTGIPTIILTFLLPQVNGLLHLYCYIVGILYGLLWRRRHPNIAENNR